MATVRSRKTHSCKHYCSKCRLHDTNNLSINTTNLSIPLANAHSTASYDNTPSPSSNASSTLIEQSSKSGRRLLSSTLKSNVHGCFIFVSNKFVFHIIGDYLSLPMKRRLRCDRLLNYTQMINRQYITSMTRVLFQMQKEIYKLKHRTNRVEHLVVKQVKNSQPIIRIPRLTKGF